MDEPAHIACGMEYLDKRVYRYEPQHPPLARAMVALLPYLSGRRVRKETEMTADGLAILFDNGRYSTVLALARAGTLPFFWLAAAGVFLWSARIGGWLAGLVAAWLFTNIPAVLAHAGLATTDMALCAMVTLALYSFVRWFEEPNWPRSVIVGVVTGLAVLVKFSTLVFLPVSLAVVLLAMAIARSRSLRAKLSKRHIFSLLVAIGCGAATIWAGYYFSFGPVHPGGLHVPAPELFRGIEQVEDHNQAGHISYLLGTVTNSGSWRFFPIVFFFKTPLAFLIAILVGLYYVGRRRRDETCVPALCAAGVLVSAMASNISIGIRHVLPLYTLLSIVAAAGLVKLWESSNHKFGWLVPAGLSLWLSFSSGLSHPDYLAYFNEFAGRQPERIAVDSDLDWGQDIKRLSTRVRELGIRELSFTPQVPTRPESLGFPPLRPDNPFHPARGWNAVSLARWKLQRMGLWLGQTDSHLWPDTLTPAERVGKSILLFYVPDDQHRASVLEGADRQSLVLACPRCSDRRRLQSSGQIFCRPRSLAMALPELSLPRALLVPALRPPSPLHVYTAVGGKTSFGRYFSGSTGVPGCCGKSILMPRAGDLAPGASSRQD
jgi:hypothetical protein